MISERELALHLAALAYVPGERRRGHSRRTRVREIVRRPDAPNHIAELYESGIWWNSRSERQAALDATEALVTAHEAAGVAVLPLTGESYPPLLRLIADAPILLFCRGNVGALLDPRTVAVIGSRDPDPEKRPRGATEYGKKVARRVAAHFTSVGYGIVSGLATGIDEASHRGALDASGRTVAVLPALDPIYPRRNAPLADEIVERDGVLLSEHELGSRLERSSWFTRDRIQAGLSAAVIAVEAVLDERGRSGTLHTVRFAETYGRLLYVPRPREGHEGEPQYEGINKLLQERRARAFTAEHYNEMLEEMERRIRQLLGLAPIAQVAPGGAQCS